MTPLAPASRQRPVMDQSLTGRRTKGCTPCAAMPFIKLRSCPISPVPCCISTVTAPTAPAKRQWAERAYNEKGHNKWRQALCIGTMCRIRLVSLSSLLFLWLFACSSFFLLLHHPFRSLASVENSSIMSPLSSSIFLSSHIHTLLCFFLALHMSRGAQGAAQPSVLSHRENRQPHEQEHTKGTRQRMKHGNETKAGREKRDAHGGGVTAISIK